jgi:hypothetical protein
MHRLQHSVNAKISVANVDTSFFDVLLQEVPYQMAFTTGQWPFYDTHRSLAQQVESGHCPGHNPVVATVLITALTICFG